MTSSFRFKRWFWQNFLAWFVGFAATLGVIIAGESIGLPDSQFFLGLVLPLIMGFFQLRMLKDWIGVDSKWMWYSPLGMGFPFILLDFGEYISPSFPDWNIYLAVPIGALLTGLLQFTLLRNRVKMPALWILICFLAWTSALGIMRLNEVIRSDLKIVDLTLFLSFIFGPAISYGLISGFGLKKMVK